MRLRVSAVALQTFAALACFVGNAALADQGQEKLTVRPLPFRWDIAGADHPCGLLLGVEEELHDKKASEAFASAAAESSGATACQVVKAMASRDGPLFCRLLLDPGAEELQGFDATKHLAYLDMPDDPMLMRVYRLGGASLYEFKSRRPAVMPVLITPSRGKHFYDIPGQNEPLCEMVVELNRAIAGDASKFQPVRSLEGYQSFELPPVFGDDRREHPARLYFKGIRYVEKAYPLSDQAIGRLPTTNNAKVDAAVRFYARAWQTLAAGDVAGFAGMLAKKDGDFVRKAGKREMMDFFVGKYRSVRQINYILYSNDVFWMVRQFSAGPYREKQLIYDMVVWDDTLKEHKLVRVFPYLDALTSLTQWKGLAEIMVDRYINADQATDEAIKSRPAQKTGHE